MTANTAVLDPIPDREIEEFRARRRLSLGRREFSSAAVLGLGFLTTALLLAFLLPSERQLSPVLVAALVSAYIVSVRVEFESSSWVVVPTQVVLVPMLFLLPLGYVPLCVALGLLAANMSDLLWERKPERALLGLTNSWHAVGPVLVLAAAGEGQPSLARWPVYVAALLAQFGFDFASTAAHMRLAHGASPRAVIGAMRPVYLVDMTLAPVGFLAAAIAIGQPYAFVLVLPLVGLMEVFARERRRRIDHALELSHAYRGTALLLGDVVEADDAYTGSHSRDVVTLVMAVAEELALTPGEQRDAELAALLHDVGKVRVPSEIINKAGPLTRQERAAVQRHTVEGERMLTQVGGLLGHVGRHVRSSHERWDGGGYPDGLAAHEIPLVSRIVACCDAYSAMTTDRSYRTALMPEEALAELRANAGRQFDPQVVDALILRLERGEIARAA